MNGTAPVLSWVLGVFLRWRLPLVVARRELISSLTRSIILVAVIGIPVAGGVATALVQFNKVEAGERLAEQVMGNSSGLLRITRHESVTVSYATDGSMNVEPAPASGQGNGANRTSMQLEADLPQWVADLLPQGSDWTPAPVISDVALAGGGIAELTRVDLSSSLTNGIVELDGGVSPAAADEVAMSTPMAEEFGLLDRDGELLAESKLKLADGRTLRVVGTTDAYRQSAEGNRAQLVMAPGQVKRAVTEFLIALPAIGEDRKRDLVAEMSAAGVGLMPREAILEPGEWGVSGTARSASDPRALAAGALVMATGLSLILAVVGAVFAVGARRDVRRLGLLTANGATRADARRFLIAPSLLLGFAAACVGAAAGIGLFVVFAPVYERVAGETLLRGVDWLSVGGVAAMGLLSAVLAALPPATFAARLDPLLAITGGYEANSQCNAGRNAIKRRWFVVIAVALGVLVAAGHGMARGYSSESPDGGGISYVPVGLGLVGLVLLATGTLALGSSAITYCGRAGARAPLAVRIGFRDAARNQSRSTAAVGVIAVIVAASIMAAAGASSAVQRAQRDPQEPARSVVVYLQRASAATPAGVDAVEKTLEEVLGDARTVTAYRIFDETKTGSTLVVDSPGGIPTEVRAVAEPALRALIGRPTAEALRVFRAGGVVTTDPRRDQSRSLRVGVLDAEGGSVSLQRLEASWQTDGGAAGLGDFSTAWVSVATASRLGMLLAPTSVLATTRIPIDRGQVNRLGLRGISAYAPNAETSPLQALGMWVLLASGLLTILAAGVAVALTSFERERDTATMQAMGAPPTNRRTVSAMHGLYLGVAGLVLGVTIGVPAALAFGQLDGAPGVAELPPTLLLLLSMPCLATVLGFILVPRLNTSARPAR